MNKFMTKIVGAALGLTMAIGVGVAVGASRKDAVPVHAENISVKEEFEYAAIKAGMKSGSGFEDKSSYILLSNSSSPELTLDLKDDHTPSSNVTLTFSVATYGSGTSPSASTFKAAAVGTETSSNWSVAESGFGGTYPSSSTYTSVTLSLAKPASPTSFDGVRITFTTPTSGRQIRLQKVIVEYTYDDGGASVSSVSLSGDMSKKAYSTVDEWNNNGLTASGTMSDSTSYSGDFDWSYNPESPSAYVVSNGNAEVTSGSVSVTATAGSYDDTKVISGISVSYATVSQALAVIPNANDTFANTFATGIVSSISEVSTANGNATYFISADGTTSNQLEIYRGKYLNNADFTSNSQIAVGDTVVVYGTLTNYKGTKEFTTGSYLISLIRPTSSLSLSENALSIGNTDVTAHQVTVTINSDSTDKKVNIAHQSGTENLFTLSTSQVTADNNGEATFTVTGTGASSGSETFRVSSNGTPSIFADLVVTANSIVYHNITMNVTGYSLTGTTYAEEGEAIDDLVLSANAKYNLPSEISITGTGMTTSDWDYDNASGEIYIYELKADLTISFDANNATVSLSLSGDYPTSFTEGDSFSSEGLVVTATYNDSASTSEVVDAEDYTLTTGGFDGNTAGTYTITVSYNGASTTYDVTVLAVVSYSYTGDDVLTQSTFGVTGTTYSSWTNKSVSDGSTAIYAGNSAGPTSGTGNGSIQLRSSNSNSGIVTTTSGGLATKVVVVWNSDCASGRVLDVYGKATAYSQASELYNSSTQGTKIGSITNGTSTELTIDSDYAYIGLRSSSGAMYLDSVTITWSQTVAETNDVDAVNTFITNYMKPTIAHNTDPNAEINNTGDCISQDWYTDARDAFNLLKTRQRAIILTSSSYALTNGENAWYYNQVKQRLLAWADAYGESLNANNQLASAKIMPFANGIESNGATIIVIISLVSLTAIGGFVFFKKRKEQ